MRFVLLAAALLAWPRSAHAQAETEALCRDARGRICRSAVAKHRFWRLTNHPHGWAGHVVDHIVPLVCGGIDAPANMQWQTLAAAKRKDRWERDCPHARAYADSLRRAHQ